MTKDQGYHPNPRDPELKLPSGATDTHCHVFGPSDRFPYSETAAFVPPMDAPKEKLYALHRQMGIERCVIVQSACHGHDNSAMIDAIEHGGGNYLGVALVPVDMKLADLKALAGQGIRGVRFNFMKHITGGTPIEAVVAMTRVLAEAGMHLQVHMESSLIEPITTELRKSEVPVVIDHLGRVDAALGVDQPDFVALRRFLSESEDRWVKVSGCDRATNDGPPYDDSLPLAACLVEEFPGQVLWGTDWPHPNHRGPVPDDGDLIDLIGRMAPTEAARIALMTDNPARLYGF